jgi:signal transduction histidine kinase/CheY-like chemotaxis protein
MKLGRRVLAALISAVTALVVLLYVAATLVEVHAFEQTEAEHARGDLARVRSALERVVDGLDRSVTDWSQFDDTYAYVQDRNASFVKANLTPSAFSALDLNALLITDNLGRPIWSGGYDLQRSMAVPLPAGLARLALPGGPLNPGGPVHRGTRGMVVLPDGATAVAARPILTSNGLGPARGLLVMGRRLDATVVRQISDGLRVRVSLHALADPSTLRYYRQPLDALTGGAQDHLVTHGGGDLSIFGLLRDIGGRPALMAQVRMPRDIYRQGVHATALFGAIVALACLVFAVAMAHLLRRHVVSRLEVLNDQVGRVDLEAESLPQVAVTGADEIASLAGAINAMLTRVAEARTSAVESRRQYDALFDAMPTGCALHQMVYDEEGRPVDYRFLAANAAFEAMIGRKVADIIGRTVTEILPGLEPTWIATYGEVAATGVPARFTNFASGLGKHFDVVAFRPAAGQFACVAADVTEQMRADAERETLHTQLAQAQKMEAVGRLAGGVAHDFNNMLMAVLNNVELARDELPAGHPAVEHLDEIEGVSHRSADLTRQLLTYASKQAIAPTALNLNTVIGGLLKMLRRIIGEDIEMVWRPGAALWHVMADPSQIDQILVNLGVNARDAMAGPGTLTVSTANVTVDAADTSAHGDALPGQYVMLTVSDTGHGMDAETLQHIFEPFYTTKGVGEGTGLGLATVFGIMQQNGGFVQVASRPGNGATFRMYLPRSVVDTPAAASNAAEGSVPAGRPGGSETVLLVEDERPIRVSTQRLLERLGYHVLSADSPDEAIAQAGAFEGKIHLLLTDITMPRMTGLELAQVMRELRPGLKCVAMSGYAANMAAPGGELGDGVRFLCKPFSREVLALTVREALDAPPCDPAVPAQG